MFNDNILTVEDEDGKILKIRVLFGFDISKYSKKYVSYVVYDEDEEDTDNKTVLIAEMDYSSNTIKSINENEADGVLYYYNKIKEELLQNR